MYFVPTLFLTLTYLLSLSNLFSICQAYQRVYLVKVSGFVFTLEVSMAIS